MNRAPIVTYVTDVTVVPEAELLARVSRLDVLPPELRARFAVQLRDPQLSGLELLRFGDLLRTATSALGIKLLVNDRIDLALALDADGVHLGSASIAGAEARRLLGERAFVSIACHSADDVVSAAEAGATACTLSPIFASPGKAAPVGVESLTAARERLHARGLALPIIALGGIDDTNFRSCLTAGAAGVAMVRAEIPVADIVHSLR